MKMGYGHVSGAANYNPRVRSDAVSEGKIKSSGEIDPSLVRWKSVKVVRSGEWEF
jgi:hypothetical protein